MLHFQKMYKITMTNKFKKNNPFHKYYYLLPFKISVIQIIT